MTKKKKSAGYDLKPLLITIGLFLIPVFIFLIYHISSSTNRLIPISAIALILGAVVENKNINEKWSTVFNFVLFSFLLSFFGFLPGKHETNYNLDSHIICWPYFFLFIFVVLTLAFNKRKLIPKLTEGITLILSIGILYWVVDNDFINSSYPFFRILTIFVFIISGFSILNAFTKIKLTKSIRLILSLWSSSILIILAIDNIYNLYQNGQIEENPFIINKIITGLEYFLLGICSVYVAVNISMVFGFLPGRGEFFNKKYFTRIKKLKEEHLIRYSDNQTNIRFSLLCSIIALAFFILNMKLRFLPRNTAIWLVFFVLNNLIYFNEKTKNNS